MADIDSIIAGANGNTKYDFAAFGDPVKAYFDAKTQRAASDLRDAFKDGVPTTSDGQPDFSAMAKTLYQKGGLDQGNTASNLALQQQQQQFGRGQSSSIQNFEGGGQPGQPAAAPQQPIVSPPSVNRSASAVVAPPLNKGGQVPQGSPDAPQKGGATVMQVLSAQGIPNDQLGAASASIARQLGLSDPNAPIDVNDPQVRNVLVPAIGQLKRMGIGQPQGAPQQPQPGPQVAQGPQTAPQPMPPQPAPQQPQVAPQAAPQGQPAPVTNAVTTTQAPQAPSRTDQAIAFYSGVMSDPRSPKQNVELAKTRLEALQQNNQLTPDQKNYSQAILEGYKGTMQDFMADNEAKKTAATEEAKAGAAKYSTMVDAGVKAQQEIPQLEMLQEQMKDPNFYSGIGENYNLMFKRLKSAVGMDPDAAVPQEFLRKATAASVLGSFGALKGLGPIRVAEMNLAKEAAAAPSNSVPANKLLVEIQKRTYQRQADIAEMAQNYKEQNGSLDAGFDKQVTAYFKSHPIFNDAEVKDFHKAIGDSKPQQAASAAPGQPQKFGSPADVHAAVASGTLKKGDTFQDSNGVTRVVP